MLLAAGLAEARVTRLDVVSTVSPTFEGRAFKSGQYELLRMRASGELDPHSPFNADIVNIEKAPRNSRGLVEYTTDVHILKPIDLSKGSSTLFYDVVNRGNKLAMGNFNGASTNDPVLAAHAGNGFLMDQGYAVVWSAWQGDVAAGSDRVVANFPIAKRPDGSPVTGLSREEFTDTGTAPTFNAALVYPAAALTGGTLTVRQREADPRQTPPGLSFTWVNNKQIAITRPAGFDSGALYEFVYTAQDPIVMGIGFAATRDVVSFLRNKTTDDAGQRNPLAGSIRHVLGFGSSQSGRFLKDLLYQGFNRDESRRKVFDGIQPHISGSRKTFTNYEFAAPGRFSRQHEDHMYPGDQFPFTYGLTYDPISRRFDGIMVKCRLTGTCPKVVHTDSELEVWQARGSLVVTTLQGWPTYIPPDVRVYAFAGTQHGPAATPARGICKNLSNPLPYAPSMRAVLSALDGWVRSGKAAPPSNYPMLQEGELAPPAAIGFPVIPGVTFNGLYNELPFKDLSTQPPTAGRIYPGFAPIVNDDGNAIGGIAHPFLSVPIGTYTGWNLRSAGNAEDEGCSLTGSYIPFLATRAERIAANDPRLSIEERYASSADYVARVEAAGRRLMAQRLLLQADYDAIVAEARGRVIP